MKILISNIKCMFLCFKFTIKKFKIYLFQLINVQNKDSKFVKAKHLVFMLKVYPNIMLIIIRLSKKKCRMEVKIDQLLLLK